MKPVKAVQSVAHRTHDSIDYAKLSTMYNESAVGDGVELDKVYNITLFKKALERRGVIVGKDVEAFSSGDVTIVKRISTAAMSRG